MKHLVLVSLFVLVPIALHSAVASTVTVNPGVYRIKSELVLPNLEDNLRYTTTHAVKCLDTQRPSRLFPILSHASFSNSDLVNGGLGSTGNHFKLLCQNAEAATGVVDFVSGEKSFRAALNIKMGGKNMKFSQRISAQRLGACRCAR